jgi:hypothetical protein
MSLSLHEILQHAAMLIKTPDYIVPNNLSDADKADITIKKDMMLMDGANSENIDAYMVSLEQDLQDMPQTPPTQQAGRRSRRNKRRRRKTRRYR